MRYRARGDETLNTLTEGNNIMNTWNVAADDIEFLRRHLEDLEAAGTPGFGLILTERIPCTFDSEKKLFGAKKSAPLRKFSIGSNLTRVRGRKNSVRPSVAGTAIVESSFSPRPLSRSPAKCSCGGMIQAKSRAPCSWMQGMPTRRI